MLARSTVIDRDMALPVRDGTVLRCDVYRTAEDSPRPAILFRTPYGKGAAPLGTLSPQQCLAGGFVAVVQDTRGRYASEGEWEALSWGHEGPDGFDSIQWISEQPWCDGNVFMAGTSYQAIVQWLAAGEQPPALRAIAPTFCTSESEEIPLMQGALRLEHLTTWLGLTAIDWASRHKDADCSDLLREAHSVLTDPASPVMRRRPEEIFDYDWFPGRVRNVIQGRTSTMTDIDLTRVRVPCLSVAGWFDVFAEGTIAMHQALVQRDGPERHALVIGPWGHGGALPQIVGEVNLGPLASGLGAEMARIHLDFFRGVLDGMPRVNGVRYLDTSLRGSVWKQAERWPPEETRQLKIVLASGRESTASRPIGRGDAIELLVRSEDPMPTHGGRVLQLGTLAAGPLNQQHLEGRPDCVVFTTPPLVDGLSLIGEQRVRIGVTSDHGTDVVCRLTEVTPDGRSILILEGHARVQGPRVGADVEVGLGNISWQLTPGHRLRLAVTTASFPQLSTHPELPAPAEPPCRRTVHLRTGRGAFLSLGVSGAVPMAQTVATSEEASEPTAVLEGADWRETEECVLEPLLRKRAEEQGEAVFVRSEDGQLTYAQTWDLARATAAALAECGVALDERVLLLLPNSVDALRCWFGINMLGAVCAPLNVAYRGQMLAQVIGDSQAGLLITRPQMARHLDETSLARLHTVVLLGAPGDDVERAHQELRTRWDGRVVTGLEGSADDFITPNPARRPWDAQTVIFTSGTTGRSKGVVSSYAHLRAAASAAFSGRATKDDTYLLQLPLFHAGGTIGVYGMLLYGGSIALIPSFKTNEFWATIRRHRVTMCTLLGVMASYLLQQPVTGDDINSPLEQVFLIPFLHDVDEFRHRFGVRVHALFNMTEISCPLIGQDAPGIPGFCGWPRQGVEARLVNEDDVEVAPDEVGELVLRFDDPWSTCTEYLGQPGATASAWRNGWFHTGDLFRRHGDGFIFVDRSKDAIRRRGENISSVEIEAQATSFPGIAAVAAVGVPCDDGEEEVLLAVEWRGDGELDERGLCGHLASRLAHFMVPRYVLRMESLPLTPTGKIRKDQLRSPALREKAWDREIQGLHFHAEALR